MTHTHRAVPSRTTVRGWSGCLVPSGDPRHAAAHGGVVEYQVCSCGDARVVEANGDWRAAGEWGPDTDAIVERIRAAARGLDDSRSTLHAAVREARDAGMSWAQIGQALGITRQSAQERFGRTE